MSATYPAENAYRSGDLIGPAIPAPASSASGVSWPAIFAGAVAATAISVMLLIVCAGLGLSSASPWPQDGLSAAIWLVVVHWISSAFGGYNRGGIAGG